MVAFALGEELEKIGEIESAESYYQEAENLFPLPAFKRKAILALERLSTKSITRPIGLKKPEILRENESICFSVLRKICADDHSPFAPRRFGLILARATDGYDSHASWPPDYLRQTNNTSATKVPRVPRTIAKPDKQP